MNYKYIRVASDLHLEGFTGMPVEMLVDLFLPADSRDSEAILVLAGDISSHVDQLAAFLGECGLRFPKVYFIPGNHEFYRNDVQTWDAELLAESASHVGIENVEMGLTNISYEELEQPLRFIFGTMWGDGGPTLADQGTTGHYLNDFRIIRNGDRRFTVQDMMARFADAKRQLRDYLEQPFDGKTVVITHHLPSRRLVSERFWPRDGSDGANGGFVGDCDNIIATLEPELWIHGHTHDTIDTKLWKTRIVCNPAGYRGEWSSTVNKFMQPIFDPNSKIKPRAVPFFIDIGSL